jgi:hypothetical protein
MASSENPDKEYFGFESPLSARWAPKTNSKLTERHDSCMTGLPIKLDLDLLQVCRQIHREACLVPYTANTFMFKDVIPCQLFLASLTSLQQQAVKSIALSVIWDDYDPSDDDDDDDDDSEDGTRGPNIGDWNELDPSLIRRLTGLNTLHLHFKQVFESPVSLLWAMFDGGWSAENLLFFSYLPLKTVTVIVTLADFDQDEVEAEFDDDDDDKDLPRFFSLNSRQLKAEEITNFILHRTVSGAAMDEIFRMLEGQHQLIPDFWRTFQRINRRKCTTEMLEHQE